MQHDVLSKLPVAEEHGWMPPGALRSFAIRLLEPQSSHFIPFTSRFQRFLQEKVCVSNLTVGPWV
jgi:hypothetical protein